VIKFLNEDCHLVHGNLRPSSIFVNDAGEWKLGGLELLCSVKEEQPLIVVSVGL
jgi:SCY1-like protein 1